VVARGIGKDVAVVLGVESALVFLGASVLPAVLAIEIGKSAEHFLDGAVLVVPLLVCCAVAATVRQPFVALVSAILNLALLVLGLWTQSYLWTSVFAVFTWVFFLQWRKLLELRSRR